jgi:hypothetical protein
VALAVLAVLTSGCGGYRYTFKTSLAPSERRVSEWRHQAIFGYVGGAPFDLEAACPNGVAEFGSRISLLNWFPALLTMGLYTPRTVHAVCAAEGDAK